MNVIDLVQCLDFEFVKGANIIGSFLILVEGNSADAFLSHLFAVITSIVDGGVDE